VIKVRERIVRIKEEFIQETSSESAPLKVEELTAKYLGRKRGVITELIKELSKLPKELRPEMGRAINELKRFAEDKLAELEVKKKELIRKKEERERRIDITLPGRIPEVGKAHPIMVIKEKIERIFLDIGYTIEEGPEIETDYYNFEALNMPPEHPARDSWSTFFITGKTMLRSHTSPVQIRTMERKKPPIRIIIPGRVYRPDWDIRHTPMFYQLEGLVVDEGITFADFKGTMEYFLKRLFGEKTRTRFRPSFFPFTEPSAEVDIACFSCNGSGCRLCGGSGWIEILGSGMVDPFLFEKVGYDPERYTGFAWGMGLDRITLLLYGIEDTRLFYENDLRLISQFPDY